jgi:quinolinate synthase
MEHNQTLILNRNLKSVKNILPDKYRGLEQKELEDRIKEIKNRKNDDIIILGHHYQRKEVIRFSDYVGDSYYLSETAAKREDVRYIIFCGVDFMAESAYILSGSFTTVLHPDTSASCPLANMADTENVKNAWKEITSIIPSKYIIPIAYINSDSELKAFCGKNQGVICTSSNAVNAMKWGFKNGEKIFFFPDENLGRNTSNKLGVDRDRVIIWDPDKPFGGNSKSDVNRASVILWKGFCHVHTWFKTSHIEQMRIKYPNGVIIVHPECYEDVVNKADYDGSTSFIVKYVDEAKDGSTIIIGTEINLIRRLADQYPNKRILPLARSLCPNMWKISLNDLLWTLDYLGEINKIIVPDDIKEDALISLKRMLELK